MYIIIIIIIINEIKFCLTENTFIYVILLRCKVKLLGGITPNIVMFVELKRTSEQ